MIYVLIGLVLFSIALVIYLNVAQNGKLPERGALVTPAVREALKVDQEALLLFHPQDDTPQCIEAVKAFEALLMPNGVVKRYVVVSTKQVAQAYSAAQQLTIPVINDESGALSKDCGVLVNLGFSKFAKKALLQVDSTGLVKSSHLVLNVNDIHALHS